ncbi:MAG: hypothetical protein WC325_09840 [Candidatus Bathyarchaeia archaeon]
MTKYCCPKCGGTTVEYNRGAKLTVCIKDQTPISEFKLTEK